MTRYVKPATLALMVLSVTTVAGAQQQKPVYVGARVCAGCHAGPGMGYQFGLWLHSKHSQAYAVLAKPESKRIAKLSGIREEPQETFTCLGCHSSGAQAEDWEKDDTFRIADGVQCESCHGPGSEYMAADVMSDPEAAMKAGLLMPGPETCMSCHKPKGTHVAVLNSPQIDFEKAKAEIAHPRPDEVVMGAIAGSGSGEKRPGPKYVGAATCGKCHSGPDSGYQHSKWRMSRHARAWSRLATPSALETVNKRDLGDDPQQVAQCLECHLMEFSDRLLYAPPWRAPHGSAPATSNGPERRLLPPGKWSSLPPPRWSIFIPPSTSRFLW